MPPKTNASPRHDKRLGSLPSSRLGVPPAIKRLFDKLPLVTYPPNPLPLRAPFDRSTHVLYIFAHDSDDATGGPSCNPSCLKWQTYLHMNKIDFRTEPSTNHASPSGSLPFLIPASQPATDPPITASLLPTWISSHAAGPRASTAPVETAYNNLLTTPIRLAYLYALYLHQPTFSQIARPLYIHTASSNALVRYGLATLLQTAAVDEILNANLEGPGIVDPDRLLIEADEAWEALSVFLGQHKWFARAAIQHGKATSAAGNEGPSLLDAAVFSYVQVILGLATRNSACDAMAASPLERLAQSIRRHENLTDHWRQIVEMYYTPQARS